MKLETIKVADLTPDPANVRRHSRRNLDSIKASLTRFGQVKPIVVDGKGVVIAGNGTLQAAIELGMTEIKALRTKLVGAEAVAYAIADNRTAELAEWGEPELAKMLSALALEDEALLDAAGWSQAELDAMALPEFKPVDVDVDGSDAQGDKRTVCPECGHEFSA